VLKRLIILFLALFYINVSSGIGIQFHYCMGELVSLAFGHHTDHNDACGDCGMDIAESSCCKDEAFLLKVYDGHHPSFISFNSFKVLTEPNLSFSVYDLSFEQSRVKFFANHLDNYSAWQTNKRYARCRIFRI